jgi:branched-chain amino acid transport system ATP-binding protein
MTAVLKLSGIGKRFGPVTALEHVDLEVVRGERHALIGPNGSGKSTLFNLISGEFSPTTGTISVGGQRLAKGDATSVTRQGIGRSFQITRVFSQMTVRQNIELSVMSNRGRRWSFIRRSSSWQDVRERVASILEMSPLAKVAETQAGVLSYSNQRSLEICLTLGTDPQVMLLDEPTAGMSRDETAEVIEFIRTITKDRTLLIVEHDMDVVFSLADRVSVLAGGRILATDTPDGIRGNQDVQTAYLGEKRLDADG